MMIRRLFAVAAALVLCFGAGCAEISVGELDALSPQRKAMLDCALAQAAAWQDSFQANYQEDFAEAEMLEEALLDAIASIPAERPASAVFFEVKGAQDMDAAQRSAFLGQAGICNSLMRPLEGAFLEATSLYAVERGDGFGGVGYVALCYAPELPVIVTAICEMEDAAIVRTGAVYGYGQYENEFLAFTGPLMTRFGEDTFEVYIYRPED